MVTLFLSVGRPLLGQEKEKEGATLSDSVKGVRGRQREKEKEERKKTSLKNKTLSEGGMGTWERVLPLISHILSLVSFGFFCYAFATPAWCHGKSPRFSGEVTIGLWYVCQVC